MNNYNINSIFDGHPIFSGTFESFRSCLEAATEKNICLHYADLRNTNLSNARIDGADLAHADFTNANLSGANLSEARLSHANFSHSSLYNICFAYSDLSHANFDGAFFGATDISGCDISHARFSTLSAFPWTLFTHRICKDATSLTRTAPFAPCHGHQLSSKAWKSR